MSSAVSTSLRAAGGSADDSRAPADCGSNRESRTPRGRVRQPAVAVINEPLCTAASTTNVPSDSPLIMRLRRGKLLLVRRCTQGKFADQRAAGCDFRRQPSIGARVVDIKAGAANGDRASAGVERAAMAAASMPIARPLVIVSPSAPDARRTARRYHGRRWWDCGSPRLRAAAGSSTRDRRARTSRAGRQADRRAAPDI